MKSLTVITCTFLTIFQACGTQESQNTGATNVNTQSKNEIQKGIAHTKAVEIPTLPQSETVEDIQKEIN